MNESPELLLRTTLIRLGGPNATYPTDTDRAIWNPDGTTADDFFETALAFFAQATASTSPEGTINDPLQP